MSVPVCARCKEPLPATRLVIGGLWVCGDCVYELEHGPSWKRAARLPRAPKGPPQEETLFPLEAFNR